MTSAESVQYLEDLAPGRTFETSPLTIEEAAMIDFATQFDPQPSHLDADAARDTIFRGLAASGWQTAAISMRLLVASDFRPAGGIVGLRAEIEWIRPVRPGDTLRLHAQVVETVASRLRPDQGVVRLRVRTLNQKEQSVVEMVLSLRALRRSASAS